jgi:hypothetical protein
VYPKTFRDWNGGRRNLFDSTIEICLREAKEEKFHETSMSCGTFRPGALNLKFAQDLSSQSAAEDSPSTWFSIRI